MRQIFKEYNGILKQHDEGLLSYQDALAQLSFHVQEAVICEQVRLNRASKALAAAPCAVDTKNLPDSFSPADWGSPE